MLFKNVEQIYVNFALCMLKLRFKGFEGST